MTLPYDGLPSPSKGTTDKDVRRTTGKFVSAARLKPIPLIFDTDLGNDVDDVLAMGLIHALQSRGECELVAVTITKDHELAAPFADAVNTFYGRGEIPIGVCRSGLTKQVGKFIGLAETRDGSELRYPHDLISGENAMDSVKLLRKTLAAADDQSVVIAQVGFSTNLANLLASQADELSSLNGIGLIKKKVKLLSVMAGAFAKVPNDKTGELGVHKEYNVTVDIPSARKLSRDWPTPILWSGFEIGLALKYPHQSIEEDYRYVVHHPLAEAYILYNPPPHDRPTWDLTSILIAIRPQHGYFDLSKPGRVTVADDGVTTFEETPNGRDQYLTLTDAQKIRTLETLVQLSSQPPTSPSAPLQKK